MIGRDFRGFAEAARADNCRMDRPGVQSRASQSRSDGAIRDGAVYQEPADDIQR